MTFFKKLDKRIISIVTTFMMTIMIVLSLFVNPVHATTGEQYGYDETPQAKVKVYFNISSDGKLLKGNDKGKTVLGRVPVEVPYFDVGDYGLAEFRRYHTNGNTSGKIDPFSSSSPSSGLHAAIRDVFFLTPLQRPLPAMTPSFNHISFLYSSFQSVCHFTSAIQL